MVAIDGYGLSCKFADVALVKETKVLFIDSWPPPVCIFLEFLITCCINFCQAKVEKPSTIDADNSTCDTKTEDLIDEWWMMNMSFFHFLNIYFLFFGNVASDRTQLRSTRLQWMKTCCQNLWTHPKARSQRVLPGDLKVHNPSHYLLICKRESGDRVTFLSGSLLRSKQKRRWLWRRSPQPQKCEPALAAAFAASATRAGTATTASASAAATDSGGFEGQGPETIRAWRACWT